MEIEKSVVFDKKKFLELEAAYYNALETNIKQFTFDGNEILVDYASYILMYLAPKFKDK